MLETVTPFPSKTFCTRLAAEPPCVTSCAFPKLEIRIINMAINSLTILITYKIQLSLLSISKIAPKDASIYLKVQNVVLFGNINEILQICTQ